MEKEIYRGGAIFRLEEEWGRLMEEKVTMDEIIQSLKDSIVTVIGYSGYSAEVRELMQALDLAYRIKANYVYDEEEECLTE